MSGRTIEHPPFFIIGSARSGTTLLRMILNAHPEIAVPPESRFIVELYRGEEIDVDDFLRALDQHDRFRRWDLPVEMVRAELGDRTRTAYRVAIEAIYRAWAHAHGKARWGDKTPRYVTHIPFLDRLFPDARFVHLIRDGRNVALSYADVPFGPKTVPRAAVLWTDRVATGISAGRALAPGRYLEILYEDLVEDTAGEIESLCSFLDVAFDPGMLDYTERARDAVLHRAAQFNPHVTEKPTAGVRAWQTQMPHRHVEIFEAIAGPLLAELGYERRFRSPSLGARAAAWAGGRRLPVARLRSSRPA